MGALPTLDFVSLHKKIDAAKQVITKAYEANNGNLFLSFSGGKDSSVLKHIVQQLYPDIRVVFSNTTNEHSEVLAYVKQFPEVETVLPKMSFTQVLKKTGFPLISKENSQKIYEVKNTQSRTLRKNRLNGDRKGNGKLSSRWRFIAEQDFDLSASCCKILKKDPLEKFSKESGLKPIIALMSGESRLRMQLSLYGNDNNGKVYPFLRTGWTDEDIWAYANLYNLRFAECYYSRTINGVLIPARDRTGCKYCRFGSTLEAQDRFDEYKITSPKQYARIMRIKNNGVSFAEAIRISETPRPPIIDLYGSTFKDLKHYKSRGERIYAMQSRIKLKKCPHCGSKKLQNHCDYHGTFWDAPHPETGEHRRIELRSPAYDCEECGHSTMAAEIHMLDFDLQATERLIEYVADSLMTKNRHDIMTETGISDRGLDLILHKSEVVRSRYNAVMESA